MNKELINAKLKWFFESFIWLFLLLLVIDIITKNIIMDNMNEGDSITLIPGFLWITYVKNYSAAFGQGFGNHVANRIVFIIIALIGTAIIMTVYIRKYNKLTKYVRACLMLILTGAIGNLIDRVFYARSDFAVVDWINFFNSDFWHWVFNIADSGVVIGAIMLIVWLIVEEVKDSKKAKLEKANEPQVKGPILSKEEKERLEAKQSALKEQEKVQEEQENESTSEVEK